MKLKLQLIFMNVVLPVQVSRKTTSDLQIIQIYLSQGLNSKRKGRILNVLQIQCFSKFNLKYFLTYMLIIYIGCVSMSSHHNSSLNFS